jgi:tRNA(Ile)-lysidine synthase
MHAFEEKLAASWAPDAWRDVTVLAAVSGGADSVALLRGLLTVRQTGPGRLIVAHLNHQLRGAESDEDQAFVVELCRQLQVPCEAESLPMHARPPRRGVEAAARAARYEFFTRTAARLGARYVVTAHTADDQAETILHRILRGTGIAGLAGMARVRPLNQATVLIRPLLACRHREVLDYLAALGQPFRHDSSNTDLRFTRNRIRHQLLPQLAADFHAGVTDAVLRLGALAHEAQAVLEGLAQELAERCVVCESATAVRIALPAVVGHPRYVVRELCVGIWQRQGWPLRAMGLAQWDQLADLLAGGAAAGSQKCVLPGGIVAEICGDQLRLQAPPCVRQTGT